jgi:hypothetical protein
MPNGEKMPFTEKHQDLLVKLKEKGVVILQDSRINLGLDLKALGLINGREAKLLGAPCFVMYGFTDTGFDHILSNHGAAISKAESFKEPSEEMAET